MGVCRAGDFWRIRLHTARLPNLFLAQLFAGESQIAAGDPTMLVYVDIRGFTQSFGGTCIDL
jgi:hypothetical protein